MLKHSTNAFVPIPLWAPTPHPPAPTPPRRRRQVRDRGLLLCAACVVPPLHARHPRRRALGPAPVGRRELLEILSGRGARPTTLTTPLYFHYPHNTPLLPLPSQHPSTFKARCSTLPPLARAAPRPPRGLALPCSVSLNPFSHYPSFLSFPIIPLFSVFPLSLFSPISHHPPFP